MSGIFCYIFKKKWEGCLILCVATYQQAESLPVTQEWTTLVRLGSKSLSLASLQELRNNQKRREDRKRKWPYVYFQLIFIYFFFFNLEGFWAWREVAAKTAVTSSFFLGGGEYFVPTPICWGGETTLSLSIIEGPLRPWKLETMAGSCRQTVGCALLHCTSSLL